MLAGIFLLAMAQAAPAIQSETCGFRGMCWGAPVEDLGPRELIERQKGPPDITVYRKPDERLSYGRARLADITYGFTDSRMTSVTLRVNSYLQYLFMKEKAFAEFGEGVQVQDKPDDYTWSGNNVQVALVSNFKKT